MGKITIGVIPAAGKGVRAYPKTVYVPKVLLEIAGKPLIVRNIEIMRDKLGINEIIIIVGYMGGMIKRVVKDGSHLGVKIRYVECKDPSIGLAKGLMLVRNLINEDFIAILGDELYINSNHEVMKNLKLGPNVAACGIMKTNNSETISKNYTITLRGNKITSLVEKPKKITNDLLGCGTYLFSKKIFEAIDKTPPSQTSGRVELTDAINYLSQKGEGVLPVFLKGDYYNINSAEDYNYANYLYKSLHFNKYKISLIIPAYNEEKSIDKTIKDFKEKVDEILVVNNSSKDKTGEVAQKAGAKVYTVHVGGYGDAIKYGCDKASGEILVIVEADNTFRAKDIGKLLEYMKDADMVIGTRTTRQMIEQGSNMGSFLRWGNVGLGKLIEALWWNQEPRFTDVGCTFRAIWKDSYIKMRENLHAQGPEFSPEMMIEALRARLRVIEIPVSYYKRFTGESKHSAGFKKIKTGLNMLRVILGKRSGWLK